MDCGFNIWREVTTREAASHGVPSYTYPARVESVIDGDTLWVIVDCGGAIFTRQKLRLHLIDAYEKGSRRMRKVCLCECPSHADLPGDRAVRAGPCVG